VQTIVPLATTEGFQSNLLFTPTTYSYQMLLLYSLLSSKILQFGTLIEDDSLPSSMCFTSCASLLVLHSLCFTPCASLLVLHSLCFTSCASLLVLHFLCFTSCASIQFVATWFWGFFFNLISVLIFIAFPHA
jgi:hypothetical protein